MLSLCSPSQGFLQTLSLLHLAYMPPSSSSVPIDQTAELRQQSIYFLFIRCKSLLCCCVVPVNMTGGCNDLGPTSLVWTCIDSIHGFSPVPTYGGRCICSGTSSVGDSWPGFKSSLPGSLQRWQMTVQVHCCMLVAGPNSDSC